jgi:hypothetical protein
MNLSAEAVIGFVALLLTIIGSAAAISGRITRMETLLQTTVERIEGREAQEDRRRDAMEARIDRIEADLHQLALAVARRGVRGANE